MKRIHKNVLSQFVYHSSSDKGQQTPTRHNSIFDTRHGQTNAGLDENVKMSPFNSRRHKSLQLHSSQNTNSSQQPINAWSHLKEHHSDAESTTSRSLPGSPSNSPTSSRKRANIKRTQSLELVSSDDGENKYDGRSRNGEKISLFTLIYDFIYVYRKTQHSLLIYLEDWLSLFFCQTKTSTTVKKILQELIAKEAKLHSLPFFVHFGFIFVPLLSFISFPFLCFTIAVLLCYATLCNAMLQLDLHPQPWTTL